MHLQWPARAIRIAADDYRFVVEAVVSPVAAARAPWKAKVVETSEVMLVRACWDVIEIRMQLKKMMRVSGFGPSASIMFSSPRCKDAQLYERC